MNRCEAQTAEGQRCPNPAQTGRPYCYAHDPDKAEERDAARMRGGQSRAEQLNGAAAVKLRTAGEVRDYLERVARDTEAGLIDPKRATAISNLCRVQLEAIPRADKEERDAEWNAMMGVPSMPAQPAAKPKRKKRP